MSKSVAIIGTRGYPSYYGGFETAVRKLAPYLVDQGWDVTVYGRKNSTRDNDPERDSRVRTIVTRGIETRSISTLSYGLAASIHASRTKPDVALVMNVANGYFLPLLRARKIPTLVNVDGIEWDRAKWGRFAKSVFRNGAKWTARHGTRMVYDSLEIARRWRDEFGLDGDFIPYGGDTAADLPVDSGLEHRGYVLVVARFVPENTIPEFIKAAESISESWPVVIVGSSGYGGEIEAKVSSLAASSTNIRWLGHISDDRRLLSLWQHAGVYFHGHSVGGTNPALVQAMAAGAPIIARDTPYNREVLGPEANLVSANSRAIELSITKALSDPAGLEISSQQNRERAAEFYSWESVCAKYHRALTILASPNASRATS